MNQLNISQVKKAALIIGAVVLIIALNASFKNFVSYQVNTLELKTRQKHLQDLQRQREGMVRRLEIFNSDKEKLQQKLFNENGLAKFLQRMPDEASRSGVKVLRMTADKDFKEVKTTYPPGHRSTGGRNKSAPTLMALPIRTIIEGPLASVEDFLIILEQYKQLLSVKDVKISTKKYPVIEGDFNLVAYIIKENKP